MKKFILFFLGLSLFLFLLAPVHLQAHGHGSAPNEFYTSETLAQFDGVENEEAYIAFEGRIYDVSDTFSEGTHQGNEAGQDLTEELKEAGHGPEVLDDQEHIGYYLEYALTEEKLAEYDGQDYSKPLVAVNNIIYDASDVFTDGTHLGYEAGQDLTEEFEDQHEEDYLKAMPVVGVLVSYELTEEELATYDGQNDNDGFIAVNGIIYDVTDAWSDGSHRGYEAGNDLTEEISEAGHHKTVLPDLPVVGIIVESE